MRVSTIKGDEGYEEWRRHGQWRVLCNGKELSEVVMADSDRRVALVYEVDRHGQLVRSGDTLKTKTVRGNIEIHKVAI